MLLGQSYQHPAKYVQGEQAEEIVTGVKAKENKHRPEKSARRMPEISFQSNRKDTLAA